MKIGIEVQRLFRKKKFGIESSSLELIKNLIKAAPHHEYVIFAKNGEDRNCLLPSENLKIKTVGGKFFADFEQFFLPFAASREKVDILHCTGNTAPYFSAVPIVQTLHDVIFMDAIPTSDTFYQRFGNHYRRKLVPLITPRSKAVITVSEYEKERIVQRLGIDPARIQVVYNGINEKRFNTHCDPDFQKSILEKYQLPPGYILFLGNHSFRKNASGALEAYVKYATSVKKPMPLVTPGLSQKFISRKLNDLKYPYSSSQFISPGYIADPDLPSVYACGKIFLFPSLTEGFGMPVVEAMACGTPVITSKTTCLPEIAGNAALLTDPYNTNNMATAILALSTNEELRREKIEAGLGNVKRFSWKLAAEKILSVYEGVYQQEKSRKKLPGFFLKHIFAVRH